MARKRHTAEQIISKLREAEISISQGQTAALAAKSIGVTALGLAIADGKIRLQDKAVQHHPAFAIPPESNKKTRWIERITIEHLATQTAGFEKPGGYTKLMFEPGIGPTMTDKRPGLGRGIAASQKTAPSPCSGSFKVPGNSQDQRLRLLKSRRG